jgi:hypothetical protein
MATQEDTGSTPELLYHTLLIVVDYHDDTSGYTRSTHPLGTHTSPTAAENFAYKALQELGYKPTDFEAYDVLTPSTTTTWPHGDSLIYAKTPSGREFLIKLDTTKNNPRLPAGPDNTPILPAGAQLYYIIQTEIEYHQDKPAGLETTEIQNVYLHRKDAIQAAKNELARDRAEFSQYDEQGDEGEGEWPFGDDVVVHGVAQTGECYTVAVRTVAETRKKFSKNREV